LVACAATAHASNFTGTLDYTRSLVFGTPNVTKLGFTYDDVSHTLTYGTQVDLATLNGGADGIEFAPNGNLMVTGNSAGNVYRLDASTGNLLQTVSTSGAADYHIAVDPSGTKFYSSDRYTRTTGPLDTFVINGDGSFNNASATPITGDDTDVTQLAFAPNGKVFYTDGGPNSNGSVGLFTFGSPNDTTTQLFAANTVTAAHGITYDPFTGLMTMFGGGGVATLDPTQATNAAIIGSLKHLNGIYLDFDQGVVDGFGHAFIAGLLGITFIDYSKSHDITSPDKVITSFSDGAGNGFGTIDGIVVEPTPEPSSIVLLAIGLAGLGAAHRRKSGEYATGHWMLEANQKLGLK
jgi:WD40 repeat protein